MPKGEALAGASFNPSRPITLTQMPDRSLSPPHVSDADKPLRRAVAMAYRTALVDEI